MSYQGPQQMFSPGNRRSLKRIKGQLRESAIKDAYHVAPLIGIIISMLTLIPIIMIRVLFFGKFDKLGYIAFVYLIPPVLFFVSAILSTLVTKWATERFFLEGVEYDRSLILKLRIFTFASALVTGAVLTLLIILISVLIK